MEVKSMNKMGGKCLNWRVLAGLAALGLGVWVVAPNLVWTALPLLLLAACSLSMLFMMRGMQGGQCASQPAQTTHSVRGTGTRDEQLAELKALLGGIQEQQEAIAREIAELETASAPVVRQAEAVARAAEAHAPRWS
jgi:hypothetical protein